MSQPADIIITDAKVFTSDESNPHAEAVAVKGNRIVYVGTNEGVKEFQDQSTRVVDGQDHTLTPGFIDTHVHLLWGSIWMGNAQLQEVRTKDDLKKVLLDFADSNKTDQWVVGRGIRYAIVSTRQELDEIIADRPVYIGAFDGHTGWANTKALEMAGILHDDGRELTNGIIVRDENRLAAGELREGDAMNTVFGLVSVPDANRKRELLKLGIQEFNKTGITSVHNMNGEMEEMLVYAALEDSNEMNMRVYVPYHIKQAGSTFDESVRRTAYCDLSKLIQQDAVQDYMFLWQDGYGFSTSLTGYSVSTWGSMTWDLQNWKYK